MITFTVILATIDIFTSSAELLIPVFRVIFRTCAADFLCSQTYTFEFYVWEKLKHYSESRQLMHVAQHQQSIHLE
jgi:hypothetical protein